MLVLPPISYGLNMHHIDFPGTIHIEPETFIAFCLNITKSVAYHGFQKILLVNGHGSNGPLVDLIARKTVLATGGLGGIFLHSTNQPGSVGHGVAMASRVGARLIDLEYVQFHPTVANLPGVAPFLVTEALRGEGAVLVDAAGRRFIF